MIRAFVIAVVSWARKGAESKRRKVIEEIADRWSEL
jgi:hypothetical protein